jgi:hypothetical protein
MVFTTSGPGGSGYAVFAEHRGVVVQVTAGGAGASLAKTEQLAIQQLRRLG